MSTIKIDGYHGTTQENANQIVVEQDFKDSVKDNEWLGTGVYFFAYKADAEWWITADRYYCKKTCILKVGLEYAETQVLDLDNPAILKFVDTVIKKVIQKANGQGKELIHVNLDELERSQKWNVVCNVIRFLYPEFGITMYTFTRGKIGMTGFRQTQKQICVSDHSIIKNIEIV